MLTPTQALVLQTITWWIRGARQRGKHSTSATSTQVSQWIAEKFHASVSPKSAQIALRHLVETGFLSRETHRQSGFTTVYRYVLAAEREIQVTVPDDHRAEPKRPPLLVNKEKENQIKGDVSDRAVGFAPPPATPTLTLKTATYRSTGLTTSVQAPNGVRSLAQIEALCREIGGGELPNPSEEPESYAKRIAKNA